MDAVSAAVMAEEPSDEPAGGSGGSITGGSLGTGNERERWNFGQNLDPPIADEEPTGSSRDAAGSVEKDNGSLPSDVKQRRFYFESDSLVLKDNPE